MFLHRCLWPEVWNACNRGPRRCPPGWCLAWNGGSTRSRHRTQSIVCVLTHPHESHRSNIYVLCVTHSITPQTQDDGYEGNVCRSFAADSWQKFSCRHTPRRHTFPMEIPEETHQLCVVGYALQVPNPLYAITTETMPLQTLFFFTGCHTYTALEMCFLWLDFLQ